MTQRPHIARVADRGFTLVEVMVALFVLALMAAMGWQGVDLVVRSRDAAQRRTDSLLRLQSTLQQWDADLRAAVDTQVVPGLACDGATLRITRYQPQGAQVVAWTVRDGALHRWAAPPATSIDQLQEAWLRSYQLNGREAGSLRALDGVQRLLLYTYYANGASWSNCQSTGNVGSSGQQALPEGLRLVLSFEPTAAFGGPVTRTLQLVHP